MKSKFQGDAHLLGSPIIFNLPKIGDLFPLHIRLVFGTMQHPQRKPHRNTPRNTMSCQVSMFCQHSVQIECWGYTVPILVHILTLFKWNSESLLDYCIKATSVLCADRVVLFLRAVKKFQPASQRIFTYLGIRSTEFT